jgi:hypothetical protein
VELCHSGLTIIQEDGSILKPLSLLVELAVKKLRLRKNCSTFQVIESPDFGAQSGVLCAYTLNCCRSFKLW